MNRKVNPYTVENLKPVERENAPHCTRRSPSRTRWFFGGLYIFSSSSAILLFHLVVHRGLNSLKNDFLNVIPATVFVGLGVLLGLLTGAATHCVFGQLLVPVRIKTMLITGAVMLSLIIGLRCRGLVFPGPWSISLGRTHWLLGLPISGYARACCILAFAWTAIISLPHA
ncbi:MAG: hypothetical protein AAF802_27910, partial [Planctomycetota bacterium]